MNRFSMSLGFVAAGRYVKAPALAGVLAIDTYPIKIDTFNIIFS